MKITTYDLLQYQGKLKKKKKTKRKKKNVGWDMKTLKKIIGGCLYDQLLAFISCLFIFLPLC